MRCGLAIVTVLVIATGGCGADVGEPAGLSLAETDRVEVREVPPGAFPPRLPGAGEGGAGDLLAKLTDPDEIEPIVQALDDARFIDLGRVDYDLVEPDYEVAFLDDGAVLARLGYYRQVSRWGEYQVEGRWLHGWDPLAVTVPLPAAAVE